MREEAKNGKVVLNEAGAASVGSPFPGGATRESLNWAIIGELHHRSSYRSLVLAATVPGWGIRSSFHCSHFALFLLGARAGFGTRRLSLLDWRMFV